MVRGGGVEHCKIIEDVGCGHCRHCVDVIYPSGVELQTKIREDFTITERTLLGARDFSWLKTPSSSFTFETTTVSRH